MNFFYNYYTELKYRFILLSLTWISTIVVSYTYKEILFFTFVKPSNLLFGGNTSYFIFTDVTEIFSIYLTLTFFITKQVILVCFLYHFLVFSIPALRYVEHKAAMLVFKFFVSTLILSNFITYYLILPVSWNFFLSFQGLSQLKFIDLYFEAKIQEYISFYISLYNTVFFNFQVFMFLLLFLGFNNNKSVEFIKNFRKLSYFFLLLLSTLLSPPDVFSQLIFSLISVLFYEFSVLYTIISSWKRTKKAAN